MGLFHEHKSISAEKTFLVTKMKNLKIKPSED